MSPVGWSSSSIFPTWLVSSLLLFLWYCLDWTDCTACDPTPCKNFGNCQTTAGGGFTCICPNGFWGQVCDRYCSEWWNDPEYYGWNSWSEFGPCSTTCGPGIKLQKRICKGPKTCAYQCKGPRKQSKTCNNDPCKRGCEQSTDGWANWSSFGSCSKNCGPGTRQRSRVCRGDNNTCHLCLGSYINTQACTVKAERDGGWSAWTSGRCSTTCGTGYQIKTRTCTNPAPNECGQPCFGNSIAYESCPEQPSCCEKTLTEIADISLTSKEAIIESGPDATRVGVIITCQAITCPGDTVQSIVLKKTQVLATVDERANGVAVNRARVPDTEVSGSLKLLSLIYVITKIRCQDTGMYHCSTVVNLSGGRSRGDEDSDSMEVTVLPGRFKVTPVSDTSSLGEDDVFKLNCSGSVGTVGSSTKVDIVWEYRNKDSRQWTRLSSPDISQTQRAEPNSCDKMVMWTILKQNLTAVDDGRTYRCYLVKDGTAHNDKITDDLGYTVFINSVDHSVSRAVLAIAPQQVTVSKPGKLQVYITCRGQKSQNELVNLILALKATGQSTMKQVRELAVAHLPLSVENKVPNKNVTITGGLISQVISYTLREASCHDTGTYICTAITKLSTTIKTTTQEKSFDLQIQYHHANIHGKASVETGANFKCTTLIRYGQDVSLLAWYWESAHADPRIAPDVPWNRVLPTQGVTIRNSVSTPPHKCYVVYTSTLHFKSLVVEEYTKFFRCYVTDGDASFQNYTNFTKLHSLDSSALLSDLTLMEVAMIVGAFFFSLLIIIFAFLKRRRSMKQWENNVVLSMRQGPGVSFASGTPSSDNLHQTPFGQLSAHAISSDVGSHASRSSYYLSAKSRTSSSYSEYAPKSVTFSGMGYK